MSKGTYKVLKPLSLGYGSTTRTPTPSRYKTIQPGIEVTLESVAPNGNVWFIDHEGERGKIEAGDISNLEQMGVVVLSDAQTDQPEAIASAQHRKETE